MDIKVDAIAVEQAVVSAIIQSAIGAKIKVAVNDLICKNWNNPIEEAVKQVIADISLKMIREEYDQQIREAVVKKMQNEVIADLVDRLWDNIVKKQRD